MSVVIAQPGQGQKGVGMPMAPMSEVQTIVLPHGLPQGLAYLSALSEVQIHQQFDALEVLSGCERNNKYQICNSNNQQFMYAKEDTDCLTRQCFGTMRPFTMNITDNNWQPLIQMYRPLKCVGSFMWCCCLQEMSIMSPPGNTIGSIKQIWTCWLPKYEVYDNQGSHIFTINGECCYCACGTDINFQVSDVTGTDVGRIIKHWGGCRELCGGVNDFSVQFPANMDVFHKTILVAATFLIDFIYFEKNKN
ncbi:phospholipid scramblase 2-like [Ruditapes philippinarum]|uniref:phospholipid scramblase 2-like n=1 Tax=Ruditapes philippinarum TaxID=129788 RepID=UPI00295B9369|nr:phospholipid scramblase 2-like [Ruditapes philippinarum]